MDYREPEEILADLHSQEAPRIAAALEQLAHCLESYGSEFPVAPFDISLLQPFGAKVAAAVQMNYFVVITTYTGFVPPLPTAERLHRLLDLIEHYGDGEIALETGLWIKGQSESLQLIDQAVHDVGTWGLGTEVGWRGAVALIENLLAGAPAVRQATLRALAGLPVDAAGQRLRALAAGSIG